MDKQMETILIECLDMLDRGEPIGEILSRYPGETDALRPILETAVRLSVMNLQPTLAAQTKSRQAFLRQAKAMKTMPNSGLRRPFFSWLLRPLATLALLTIGAIGFVRLSTSALPGDALYGAKMFIENTQSSFAGNSESTGERLRQNRILEIEALLEQNREAEVTFRGQIDEVQLESWRIEGLVVIVSAAQLESTAQVGDIVEVKGWVTNGRLIASSIAVVVKNATPLTPEPITTPLPAPTEEPTQTPITEATGVTAVPTQTSTSSPSPTTTPTATLLPPTFTAVPTHTPFTPEEDEEDDDEPDDDSDDDNNGPGSSNSGSGSGSDDDNSGSGSSNSGSGSSNSGSGRDDD